ncbi:hypothetical protein P7C70_g7754, partial [Phenoliferia sp. Uapishka_3]
MPENPPPPPSNPTLPFPAPSATPARLTQSNADFRTPSGAVPSVFRQPSSATYNNADDDWTDGQHTERRASEMKAERLRKELAAVELQREKDVELVQGLCTLLTTSQRSLGELLGLVFDPEMRAGRSYTTHLTHFLRPDGKTSTAGDIMRLVREHPLNFDSIKTKAHQARRKEVDTPTSDSSLPPPPGPQMPGAFPSPSPAPVPSTSFESPLNNTPSSLPLLPFKPLNPPRAIRRQAPLTSARAQINELAVVLTCEDVREEQRSRWGAKANFIGTASQWDTSFFEGFSLREELAKWRDSALFRVLSSATKPVRDLNQGPEPEKSVHARELVCTVFCLAMIYLFKASLSGFQASLAVVLFASGAPVLMYSLLNRFGLCVAYKTTLVGLEAHGNSLLAKMQLRVKNGVKNLTTFDNINSDKKVWEGNQRAGKSTSHQDGVAAYVAELDLGTPERTNAALDRVAWDKAREDHRTAGTGRAALTAKIVADTFDERHQQGCAVIQVLDILCDIVPVALSKLKLEIRGLYKQFGLEKSVSTLKKTVMTSLRTSGFNEAKTAEHAYIVVDLLMQQGLTEEEAREWIRPFTGDWLSIDRLRKIILQKSHERPELNLSHILPVIALWHMRWAELRVSPLILLSAAYFLKSAHVQSLVKTNWGGGVADGFSLSTGAKVAGIAINVNDVKFKPGHNLVILELGVLTALYWKGTMDAVATRDKLPHCATLEEYFDPAYGKVWTLGELVQLAENLVKKHWVSKVVQAMELDPSAADQTSRAAHIFFRRAIRWRELALAVSMGDGGRCYEVIKMFTLTFAGCLPRSNNYMAECLDVICQFEYELPPLLRELIEKEIFTINPTGSPFGRKEPDIALETIIKEVKTGAGASRVTSYADKHYTHVVSPNSIAMGDARRGVREQFGLAPKSGKHGILADSSKYLSLLAHRSAGKVQFNIPNRHQDHQPRDDEAEGHEVLQSVNGVAAFVARTSRNPLRVSEPTTGLSASELEARNQADRQEMGDRDAREAPSGGGPELEEDEDEVLE